MFITINVNRPSRRYSHLHPTVLNKYYSAQSVNPENSYQYSLNDGGSTFS